MQDEEPYDSLIAVIDGFRICNEAEPEEPLFVSRDREEKQVVPDYTGVYTELYSVQFSLQCATW